MPRPSKLRKIIVNSEPAEWERFENPSSWALWDEEITISDIGHYGSGETASVKKPDFLQKSETNVHEKSTIRITYRGTPFDQLPVLRLDSDRIQMVKPKINQSTGEAYLDEYETHLSQTITSEDILELRGDILQLDILEK